MGCVDLTEQNHGVQKGSSQPCPKSVEADIMKINGTANKGDGSNDRITEANKTVTRATRPLNKCHVWLLQGWHSAHDTNSILLNSYI